MSSLYNPNSVGGLPLVDGPSGLRPDSAQPTGDVENTDNGPMDQLALSSVNDVQQYWQEHYSETLDGTFEPITN